MDLSKKLPRNLQVDFREAVNCLVNAHLLSDELGVMFVKKKPLLFLRADLDVLPRPKTGAEPKPQSPPPAVDFAARFEEAFARLDGRHGGHNHVNLVELRQAVPVDRAIFDAGLQQLRRAGRYSLSAAEGRHGLEAAGRDAAIHEDGSLLLFVSRRE